MTWSQICLRVMLWALASTALLGISLIFATDNEILGRLLGTAAETAGAAGLMWPAARLAENPRTRVAGLFGMAAIVVDFILLLFLIWGQFFFRPGEFYAEEALWWTFWFLIFSAAPGVFFLAVWNSETGWRAARVGVVGCALMFIELILAAWQGQRHGIFQLDDRWMAAALFTGLYGLLIVGNLTGPLLLWPWVGVAASILAWMMVSVHQFQVYPSRPGEATFAILTTLAALSAFI